MHAVASLPACALFAILSGLSVAGAYGVRDDMVHAGHSANAIRSELHHPRHRAYHVTRLHRYDHSGLAVFLEREADWHSGRAFDSASTFASRSQKLGGENSIRRNEEFRNDVPAPIGKGFLQVSRVQAESLRQHQQAHMKRSETFSVGGSHANMSRAARYSEHEEELARPTEIEKSALQRFTKEHIGIRNGRAVTRMSNLASQYVGPIGVGTTLQPKGCKMPASSLLHLDAAELEELELATTDGKKVCHASEQSKIWVVFDTGSTNIWVASDLCEHGACAKTGRMRYNHTKSLTFSYPENPAQLTVEFGTGKLVGPTGVDDFHIGPFSVFQQTFGLIQSQNGSVFEDVPFEGILGLAFPAMSANKAKPFFDTVIEQRALQKNEFAFYFSRDTPSANAIFWGGVEEGFYKGNIEYFPVTDPYYWAVDLHAFKIGDDCLLGPNCKYNPDSGFRNSGIFGSLMQFAAGSSASGEHKVQRRMPMAIVDTGTTYFTAEGYIFEEVMKRLPPARCMDITDETHPTISYTLKNIQGHLKHFKFSKDMYMTESSDNADAECSPAFMRIDVPAKHGPAMVLGEVFLRHYFAVFDRGDGSNSGGRLGLAPSVHTKDALRRLHELTKRQPSFEQTRGQNIMKYTSSLSELSQHEKALQKTRSQRHVSQRKTLTLGTNSIHVQRALSRRDVSQ